MANNKSSAQAKIDSIFADLDNSLFKPKKGLLNMQEFHAPAPSGLLDNFSPNTAAPYVKGNLTSIKNNLPYEDTKGWWDSFLEGAGKVGDFISRPQRAVTSALTEWTDGGGVLDGLKAAGQGLTGKRKDDFEQVLENMGWEDKKGKFGLHDVASFIGDTVLDPLTYLTLGAGSAAKATAKGVTKAAKTGAKVEDAVKASKAASNNRLIGIDIPFGKDFTLVNKPQFMRKESQKIGNMPASTLHTKFDELKINPDEQKTLVSQMFNRPINSFTDLNTQEFDFLMKQFDSPDFTKSLDDAMNNRVPNFNRFDDVDIVDPLKLGAGQDLLGFQGSKRSTKAKNVVDADFKNVDPLADIFAKTGNDYTHFAGLDGVSKLGKAVGTSKVVESAGKLLGSRRFVPMSTKLRDHRVQEGLGTLLDERNKGFAYSKEAIKELETMQKEIAKHNLTPDEIKAVSFSIENKFPEGFKESISPERMNIIENVADQFKGFRDRITKMEKDAGADYNPRDNYFPHIMNLPQEGTKEWDDLMTELFTAGREDVIAGLQNAPKGFTKQRKGFQTMADLHDYLQKNPDSQFKNAAFDPFEAFGRRAISGMQEVARLESIKAIKEMGLARPIKGNVPAGWERVQGIKELEGMMVPKEIHKEFVNINKLLTSDVELNKFWDKAEKMYNIWRRNVTVTRLGFHVRQSIGNIFQNTLAGVTPKAYASAGKYLANPDKYPQLNKELLENGVLHTGSTSADLMTTLGVDLDQAMEKSGALGRLNPLGEHFVLGDWGRKAGEIEDNMARVAHFIHMKKIGMSSKEAADSVRKYLYNYSEINSVGRVLRVAFPFYQWMRNNLPFQLVNSVKNPRNYAIANRFLEESQNAPNVDDAMTELGINMPGDRALVSDIVDEKGGILPDYIRRNYMNVGGNEYFNLGLPSSDLEAVLNPAEYLMNSINPAVQTAMALNTNRKPLTSAPVDPVRGDNEGVFTSPQGMKYGFEQMLGGPGQIGSGVLDLMMGDLDAGMKNIRKGTGTNTIEIDPAKTVNGLLFEKRAELERLKKKAKKEQGAG